MPAPTQRSGEKPKTGDLGVPAGESQSTHQSGGGLQVGSASGGFRQNLPDRPQTTPPRIRYEQSPFNNTTLQSMLPFVRPQSNRAPQTQGSNVGQPQISPQIPTPARASSTRSRGRGT